MTERKVNVKKGQTVLIDAGRGAQIQIERDSTGAVLLRNATTDKLLRQWSPKEASGR